MLFGLASCENFLDNGDIKKEIDEYIEIANSSPITYFVTAEEGSGTATPDQVKVKKKETFDLRFKPSGDWKFIRWEAINKSNGEPVENAIKFENPDQTETKAQVINPGEGLLIHAKCVQIPTIVDISPKGTSYANEPIVVKFNSPVEAEELTAAESLFKLANIKLSCNGESINDYFEEPVFNADKTELTILPKSRLPVKQSDEAVLLSGYLKEFNSNSVPIDVEFTDSIVVIQNEISLGISNPQFTVFYSSVTDQTPPKEYSFFVTRDSSITLENADSFNGNKFSTQDISIHPATMSDTDYANMVYENACNGTVYIYGRYYDDGSGVKSVIVKELHTHDTWGNRFFNVDAITTEYTASSENAYFETDNNETRFLIKHVFTYDTKRDSEYDIVRMTLNVSVNDYCYNSVKLDEYKVVKINELLGEDLPSDSTVAPLNKDNWVDYNQYVKSKLASIKASYFFFSYSNFVYYAIDGAHKLRYDDKSLDVQFQYNKKNGEVVTKPAIHHDGPAYDWDGYEWDYTLTFDMSEFEIFPGAYIKMIVTDKKIGVSWENEWWTFPSVTKKIIPCIYTENGKKYVKFDYEDGQRVEGIIIRTDSQGHKECKYTSHSAPDKTEVNADYTYSLMINYIERKDFSFSIANTASSINEVNVKTIDREKDIKKSSNKGYLICTLKLDDDVWSNYDYITAHITGGSNKIVQKGVTSIPVEFQEKYIFSDYNGSTSNDSDWPIATIYGYKNNLKTQGTEVKISTYSRDTISDENKIRFDNTPPAFIYKMKGNDIELIMEDQVSGVKEGKIELKNKTLLFNSSKTSYTIPVNEVVSSTDDVFAIHFTGEDKAGNKMEKTINATTFITSERGRILKSEASNTDKVVMEFLTSYNFPFLYLKFDESQGFDSEFVETQTIGTYYLDIDNTTLQRRYIKKSDFIDSNTYYKIVWKNSPSVYNYNYSANSIQHSGPMYCYSGTPGSGESDFLIPNGNSKESVVINSDKPVFVHTVATSLPLKECRDWDYTEWEYYKEEHGEKILQFSETSSPKVYNIPEIEKGKCYVVIAHYSDNHVLVSDVMVK